MRLEWLNRLKTKKNIRRSLCRPRLEQLEDRLAPAVFTVINTDDAGPGSVRQAIDDANHSGGADEITFAIPGAGVHTIFLADQMIITDPVTIDGYTQPGSSPNSLAVGDNAVLQIEIDGSFAPPITGALIFNGGGGSTVRGLVINHMNGFAFDTGPGFGLPSDGNTIAGNFIGTDVTGMVYAAGSNNDIFLEGVGNTIGGPTPADRNVIVAGSSGINRMITFDGDTRDNTIQGNYFGVNAAGAAALNGGNPTQGMFPGSSSKGGNTIEDNVIVASDFAIKIESDDNVVRNNLIGTNAAGTAGLGGGEGVVVQSSNTHADRNTITGNLISGGTNGIDISTSPSFLNQGLVVQGNKIGADITGTAALPNSGHGIRIEGPGGGAIGGTNPGEGNLIAFNAGAGVVLFTQGTNGYVISGNSIFANGGLGIDLGDGNIQDPATAVNPNDPGDPDSSGPNLDQNYPALTSATAGSSTTIAGTLNSTPNTTFQIEFFAGDAADPSGFGEGQTFLGFTSVTTDANGDAGFSVTLPAAVAVGQVVTATATDTAGNTSEFSQVVTAASQDVIIDANTPQSFLDGLTVIHGNLIMKDVCGRTDLLLPNLTEVDGDFIVTGNCDLGTLDAPLLASVGGNVDVSDNPALTTINLGSLGDVGGDLSIDNDTATTTIDVGSLTTVTGNLSINGDTATTAVDVGSLTTVGGNLSISNDTATTTINVSSLTTAGGNLNIDNDTAVTDVDVGSLITVGANLSIVGDTATTTVNVGSVTTLGGSLNINGDTATTTVDVSSLTTVGGDASVSGNTHMTTLSIGHVKGVGGSLTINDDTAMTSTDLGSLTTVNGNTSFDGDPAMTSIDLGSLTTISGNLSISGDTGLTATDLGRLTTVTGNLNIDGNTAMTATDLGSLTSVTGNLNIDGNTAMTATDLGSLTSVTGNLSINGSDSMTAVDLNSLTTLGGDETVQAQNSATSVTANGSTQVNLFSATARMTAALAQGTFADPVFFTVTRLDPAALPPEPGQDSTGAAATIDPVAAYQFNFAIPTLGAKASLTFEINLAGLSDQDRTAFLDALAAGNATVAVKNDAAGSVYQAFAISAQGQPPDATHVTISQPDANHVVFQGVTGHFSTFAVVIVSHSDNQPPVAGDDVAALDTSTSASVIINVLANDVDVNGDALTVTAVTQPASGHGTVTINADGALTYTQTVFVSGSETFTYTISDGHGGTATAAVTVMVNLPAAVGIDMLVKQVADSGLSRGRKNSLTAKLDAAQRALASGHPKAAAYRVLAFYLEVRAFKRVHILDADEANLWLFESVNILKELGWEFGWRR